MNRNQRQAMIDRDRKQLSLVAYANLSGPYGELNRLRIVLYLSSPNQIQNIWGRQAGRITRF